MPPDTSTFGKLLGAFIDVFSQSYGRMYPEAMHLLGITVILEFVILGLTWAVRQESNAGVLMSKLFTVSVLAWLLQQWPELMEALLDSCIEWGRMAAGGSITSHDFRSPGNIFTLGIKVFMGLLEQSLGVASLLDIPRALIMGAVNTIMGFFILLAFGVLVYQVAVAIVEFYLGASFALLLIPFGAFSAFTSFAEKAIGYAVAGGVKLAVLSFIVSVGKPLLDTLNKTSATAVVSIQTIQDVLAFTLGVVFLAYLSWKGPALSGGILGGGPVLSASNALQTVASLGAAAAAAVGAVVTGGAAAVAGAKGAQALGAAYKAGGMAAVRSVAGEGVKQLASNTLARFQRSGGYGRSAIPHDHGGQGNVNIRI